MGRAVVVTGATRGLGRGIARGFAQPENTVVITGRDEIALADACSEIEQRGAKAIPIRCDHSDDAQVRQAFAAISEKLDGKIDILVNNAAAVYPQDLMMPGGFWQNR
jgi:NAD(P)-dependent dehydrogenase (short-subunit alcohol dehydrogenase family)